jgi:hypothetical protein
MREEEVDVAVFGLCSLHTYPHNVTFVLFILAIDNNMLLMMLLRCV